MNMLTLVNTLTDKAMIKINAGMTVEEAIDRVTEKSAETVRNLVRLNVRRQLLNKEGT